MSGMMGGTSNNNNNNNNMDPNDPNYNSNNMAGQQQQGGNMGNSMGNSNMGGNDRYESTIQSGEGYVKSHYSNDANVMRGEQFVEKADQYRLGRNNMGNMQGGVGGMMSSDPNVSAQNPQAGNNAGFQGMGGDFNKQQQQGGTDTSFDKEQSDYGTNGGMGPGAGLQQGGMGMQQGGMGMQQGGMGMQQGGMNQDNQYNQDNM